MLQMMFADLKSTILAVLPDDPCTYVETKPCVGFCTSTAFSHFRFVATKREIERGSHIESINITK